MVPAMSVLLVGVSIGSGPSSVSSPAVCVVGGRAIVPEGHGYSGLFFLTTESTSATSINIRRLSSICTINC